MVDERAATLVIKVVEAGTRAPSLWRNHSRYRTEQIHQVGMALRHLRESLSGGV
jgi:hypothetical protein